MPAAPPTGEVRSTSRDRRPSPGRRALVPVLLAAALIAGCGSVFPSENVGEVIRPETPGGETVEGFLARVLPDRWARIESGRLEAAVSRVLEPHASQR